MHWKPPIMPYSVVNIHVEFHFAIKWKINLSIYHWDSLNTIHRKQTIVVALTNGTVSKQIDFMKCECKCCRHQLNGQCILLLNMYCVEMLPEGVYRRWDDYIVYSQLPIVQLLNVLPLWSFKCYLMKIFHVKALISSA